MKIYHISIKCSEFFRCYDSWGCCMLNINLLCSFDCFSHTITILSVWMQVIQWKRSRNTCWRQQLSNAGILFGFASTLCWCHWKILLHLLSSTNPSIQWFQTLHPSPNVAHATICQGKSRFPHCYRRKQLTKDLLRRKAVLIPLV
jgi:hypothetical protein